MKNFVSRIAALLLLLIWGTSLHAQTKTVKIKEVKALTGANEFILTWEGDSYKSIYYEVKAVLDAEPMVLQQNFLHNLQRISAIVKEPWKFAQLQALFIAKGFAVVDKSDPVVDAANPH